MCYTSNGITYCREDFNRLHNTQDYVVVAAVFIAVAVVVVEDFAGSNS